MTRPTPEEIAKWDRWFAVEMNGQAWTLAEQPDLTPAQQEEMLHAAHASALHWGRVGTDLNRARADLLLGQIHARVGHGAAALRHAQRSYDYVTTHESPDWEIAFAHAVLSHAAHVAHNEALHSTHYAKARVLGEALPNAEDKEIFQRTFVLVPPP